ncbi:hypothetical protein GYMLUDRAFT_178826 [Collybiopsis luxurians FD-317 M1]|uniref:Reverse transcriptase zinc-binding domain-containing protein n=1 Tax=Collybiopsis luxurians FD-317 M1 TaxID=944289 RepID=A0A0D0BFR5_9AGAR|nr:hypothetical protein GYMLUDRAFT_178826 [Collybiopsis luxurians FD-317 M1]
MGLKKQHSSILVQLCSSHSFLYQHLHQIGKVDSPVCLVCKRDKETPFHYLLRCPVHRAARVRLQGEVGYCKMSMAGLLNEEKSLAPLFQYINNMRHFHYIFGVFPAVQEEDKEKEGE